MTELGGIITSLRQKLSGERSKSAKEYQFGRFCAEHTICPGSDLAKLLRSLTVKFISQTSGNQSEQTFHDYPRRVLGLVARAGIINREWLEKIRQEARTNAILEAASKVKIGGWPERSLTGINMAEVLWNPERTKEIAKWADEHSQELLKAPEESLQIKS